jgi:hypothetical protein
MVERLESDIDRYMERVDLPPKFVIPGGTELSARLDVARAAVRRAERRVAELKAGATLADETVCVPEPALRRGLQRWPASPTSRSLSSSRERMRASNTTRGRQAPPVDRDPRALRLRRTSRRTTAAMTPPQPAGAAGGVARELHRDHDGDVRERKGWELGDVSVEVDYEPAQRGSPTRFKMVVNFPKELPEEQRERLMQIGAKCPVHP